MPSGQGAGTNPIHNKQKKKKVVEEDEEDKAFKQKQMADKKAKDAMAKGLKDGKPLGKGLKKS